LDSPRTLPEHFALPQSTIARYWHSMLEHRHLSALQCFLHATGEGVERMLPLPDLVELRVRDFRVADRGRGQVDVAYKVEYRVAMGDSLEHFETGDRLSLTHTGWKIDRPILVAYDRR
jgi:hypothetical protein